MRTYFWLHNPILDPVLVEEYDRSQQVREVGTTADEQFFRELAKSRKPVPPPVEAIQPAKARPAVRVPSAESTWVATGKPAVRNAPDVNLQQVLNSGKYEKSDAPGTGVVFDQQSNVKIEELTQRLEAERQQKQVVIDRKLEALKKRKPKQS